MTELSIKEDLFFTLSSNMGKEEAQKETERISNSFKSLYIKSENSPINGNDIYRYYLNKSLGGYHQELESRIDKYIDGVWVQFLLFNDGFSRLGEIKCREILKRLVAGGNSVMEI
jgi:hypothetical protein